MSTSRELMEPQPVSIPPGAVYVLGDHLDSSNDSRNPAIGLVPFDKVEGLVTYRYYSADDDGIRWDRMFMSVE